MDYLKAFTIGSSSLTWFQHILLVSLLDKNEFDYSIKDYSIIAPLYFGFMTMFSEYLRQNFKISLSKSLFITSIISIIFVFSLNYFVSRKSIKPYKNYNIKDWIKYFFINGNRHIIEFNFIIYYFIKYFSNNYWLKIFIIGSSFFSYAPTYLRVIYLDNKNKINYDFKYFAVFEATMHGVLLLISLYILQKLFGNYLKQNLIVYGILTAVFWLPLAYYFKTYNYNTIKEWIKAFVYVCIRHILVITILYYLITRLK